MPDERRQVRNDRLNVHRRKDDVQLKRMDDRGARKEIWSPLDFDKKYLELAQTFLDDDETDEAA